jgi:hypothetical protein
LHGGADAGLGEEGQTEEGESLSLPPAEEEAGGDEGTAPEEPVRAPRLEMPITRDVRGETALDIVLGAEVHRGRHASRLFLPPDAAAAKCRLPAQAKVERP